MLTSSPSVVDSRSAEASAGVSGVASNPTQGWLARPLASRLRQPAPRGVAGGGEADAHGAATGAEDHRIDPHGFTARVEQRAAGIARIDRRVGLQDAAHLSPLLRAQCTADRANHAGGDRALEAEGVANGDGELAYPHAARVGEGDRAWSQARGQIDLDDGQVSGRVAADQPYR